MQHNYSTGNKTSEPTPDAPISKMREQLEEYVKARRGDRQLPQVKKRGTLSFFIGFLAAVVPVASTSILSGVLEDYGGYYWLWFLAAGLEIAVLLTALVLTATGVRSIARGMWVGFAVNVLALGTTCFANAFGF